MAAKSMKPWHPADCIRYRYERANGEHLEVYARNKLEALAAIRDHGFLITDPAKLTEVRPRKKLTDILMSGEGGL